MKHRADARQRLKTRESLLRVGSAAAVHLAAADQLIVDVRSERVASAHGRSRDTEQLSVRVAQWDPRRILVDVKIAILAGGSARPRLHR